MKLEIPTNKDDIFSLRLFQTLSDGLTELKLETGKWPDKITFSGPLGKEVLNHIKDKKWDLNSFNPTSEGIVNKIIINYSKPIHQIEEKGKTIFDEELSIKKINGIPSQLTASKIKKAYSNFAYTIERSIRPSYEIRLIKVK